MVTDYDCWHQTHQEVSVEMVLDNLRSNTEVANKIIFEVAKLIEKERPKVSLIFIKRWIDNQKENIPSPQRKLRILLILIRLI